MFHASTRGGTVQWARACGRRRWVEPQIGQVAILVVASTSRKLAQPFVRQKGWVGWAAAARRRSRRMELARPAYVAVEVRDIIECCSFVLSGAPQAVSAWAATLGSFLRTHADMRRVRFR
jgi:hypothetical protein